MKSYYKIKKHTQLRRIHRLFKILLTIMCVTFILSTLIYTCNSLKRKSKSTNTQHSNQHSTISSNIPKVTPLVLNVDDKIDVNSISYYKLDVPEVLQNPELPTGCEVTALSSVLSYLGYPVDKVELANDYLPKGELYKSNPWNEFVGNPESESSYGCYSNVIEKSAETFLDSVDSSYKSYNETGSDFSKLVQYMLNGHPVIVWQTMYNLDPVEVDLWTLDTGEQITWMSNEHCMVLMGINNENDTYIMMDSLKGIVEYDKTSVEQRYEEMGRQAIVIK